MKLSTWIQKSKMIDASSAELPMVNGIDKIKILKCKVIKKEIIKGRDGDFIVNNCGPVLSRKRATKPDSADDEDDHNYNGNLSEDSDSSQS